MDRRQEEGGGRRRGKGESVLFSDDDYSHHYIIVPNIMVWDFGALTQLSSIEGWHCLLGQILRGVKIMLDHSGAHSRL